MQAFYLTILLIVYKLHLFINFGIFKMDFGDFLYKHRAEWGGQPVTPALRSKVQTKAGES